MAIASCLLLLTVLLLSGAVVYKYFADQVTPLGLLVIYILHDTCGIFH